MNRTKILILILVLIATRSFANIEQPHAELLYTGLVTTTTSVSCQDFEGYMDESIEKKQLSVKVTLLLYNKVLRNLSPKKIYKGKDIDVRTKIIFSNINKKTIVVCMDNFYIQVNDRVYNIDKNLRDYIRRLTK
jgi:hypothetical protein